MNEPEKYGRYNNCRMRIHESDSSVTVRRLGTKIQMIFFKPNHEPAFAETFGNDLKRLSSQGPFPLTCKPSTLQYLPGLPRPAPTNCPSVSKDGFRVKRSGVRSPLTENTGALGMRLFYENIS